MKNTRYQQKFNRLIIQGGLCDLVRFFLCPMTNYIIQQARESKGSIPGENHQRHTIYMLSMMPEHCEFILPE